MANEENKIKEQAPIVVKESKSARKDSTAETTTVPAASTAEEMPEGMITEGLSWTGKLFFAGLAGYLASKALQGVAQGSSAKQFPFKIKGTQQQIQAVTQIIMSTKEFQEEIRKPGATVDSVIRKLNLQNLTKEKFRLFTGKMWPLP